MKFKVRKRPFLLLEVMIAIVLIALSVIPLIYPHVFILTEQKKFVHRIELDHVVNLIFADIVEQMYRNELSWNQVFEGTKEAITAEHLRRVQYEKSFPFKGEYWFEETDHKPLEDSLRKLYLLNLNLIFVPETTKEKDPKPLTYQYKLFVIRDLREEETTELDELEDREDQG